MLILLLLDMLVFQGRVFEKKVPAIAKGPGPGPGPAGLTLGPGPGPGPAFTHSSTLLLGFHPMTRHVSKRQDIYQNIIQVS